MDFQRSTAKWALACLHNNFCAATDLLLSYPFPYPPDHDRDPELELEPGLKPEPEPQYVKTATVTSINFGSPTGSKTPSHYVHVHLLCIRIGSPCVGFAYDKLTATKVGNTFMFLYVCLTNFYQNSLVPIQWPSSSLVKPSPCITTWQHKISLLHPESSVPLLPNLLTLVVRTSSWSTVTLKNAVTVRGIESRHICQS